MRQLLVIFVGATTAAVVGAASDRLDIATGLWEMRCRQPGEVAAGIGFTKEVSVCLGDSAG
jgi:hypothetical protein